MSRVHGEDGLAALELAIVSTLFVALLALVAPLAYLFYENLQLGRTAGAVVRFASSRSDVARTVDGPEPPLVVPRDELATDTAGAVEAEVARAYTGLGQARLLVAGDPLPSGGTVPALRSNDAGSGCPSGRRVTVVVATTVDIGPFAGLLFGGTTTRVLTAQATSCEE